MQGGADQRDPRNMFSDEIKRDKVNPIHAILFCPVVYTLTKKHYAQHCICLHQRSCIFLQWRFFGHCRLADVAFHVLRQFDSSFESISRWVERRLWCGDCAEKGEFILHG